MERIIEFLTTELKNLVGWGAHPKRLALLPTLRTLAGVSEDISFITAGYIVRRYVEVSISRLQAPGVFQGRHYEAHELRRWLRLLLQFEGTGQSAENRRYRVVTGIGLPCSIDKWRREFGPERELMAILARHMVTQTAQP